MADELNGISLSEKDILGALQGLFSNGGTTTKTFEVKTKGFKEVAKEAKEATRGLQGFGKALEEITSGKAGDNYINKLNEITNLIADKNGKFRKVNVQSFTSELSKALVDPTTNAQKLSKIIDDVYDNLMALSQVSNSKNFNFFNETQLKNIIEMQKKQNQLKNRLDIEQGNRRTEAMNMYRDVDILTASRVKHIDKVRHTEIADSLGIDKSNIDLFNGDDALLSDYKQVADLLAKMISEREEFNKLNSKNVGDYVQQEQDLLSVFRQLQSIENKVQGQFDVDPSKLLSNQFKNKNGQFDFYSNANKAVREYTNVMTSSVSKELQQAVNRQKELVLKASSKQVQRAESNVSSIQRGRFKPNADVVNNGEEIGDSVAHGMHQAEEAIDSAGEEIKQYIVSVDESIDKIHDLFDEIDAINEQIDSGLSGKKEDEALDSLDKKYSEIAKYKANLERQGFSQKDFDDEFTKEVRKEIEIQVKALQDSDLEQQILDIKSFVESKPIEIPITTEMDKKTDEGIRETSDKINVLSDDISNRTKITIFDGVSEQVFDVEKDIDSLLDKLDEMAQKMQTPVFHAGNLNPSAFNNSNYRPADSLQFVTERHMGSSMGTGTYFGSNMADIIDTFRNKNKNGQNTELYAADLAKYQNSLLQFSGDEEQEAFGEFLKKVTAFIMSIATEDEKFRAQIKGIEPGDTESLFNELKSWFDIFNVNIHSLQEFVDEEVQYIKGFASTSDMAQSKSIGTRFQEKFIGNKGIDATRGALNDSYAMGSVIFDIDKSHPFDISFGNNEDIATYFYQKVIERILSKKAANPENYVDDIVNEYLTNSNLKQITSMTSDIQPRLGAIHEAHKNDLPESIETLNASLLKQKTTQPSNIEIDTSSASQTINELKNEIESLKEQLQKFKDMDATPEGFEQLQEKLKQTEQRADSLSQELSSVYEHSVPDSDYRNLEESLSQAKDEAIELREELEKIEKEKQDDNIGIIQNSSQISSEETHIDTLYDELIKLRDLKKELAGIDLNSEDGVDQGYSLMYQIHELEDKLHELYSYNKDHHIIDAESTIDDISRIENKLMHGTILTMFRGTDNPDNPILSKGEHGGGTFFTDDIDSAKYYGENGKLYQAKLMIKDALEFIPDVNSMVDAVTFTGNGTDDVSARLKAAIDFVEQSGHSLYDFRNILMERYDEFRDGNDFVIPFDSLDEQLKNALMTIKTISEDTNNIYGVYRTTDTFAEKARTNGYDSLIIHDISEAFNQIGEEIKSTIAVIFDKNQLLSHIEIKPDESPISLGGDIEEQAKSDASNYITAYRKFFSSNGLFNTKDQIAWFSSNNETISEYLGNQVAKVQIDPSKFLTVDANGARFDEILFNDQTMDTDAIAEYARQMGYLGVQIRNVYDAAKGGDVLQDTIAIFNTDLIKSFEKISGDEPIVLEKKFKVKPMIEWQMHQNGVDSALLNDQTNYTNDEIDFANKYYTNYASRIGNMDQTKQVLSDLESGIITVQDAWIKLDELMAKGFKMPSFMDAMDPELFAQYTEAERKFYEDTGDLSPRILNPVVEQLQNGIISLEEAYEQLGMLDKYTNETPVSPTTTLPLQEEPKVQQEAGQAAQAAANQVKSAEAEKQTAIEGTNEALKEQAQLEEQAARNGQEEGRIVGKSSSSDSTTPEQQKKRRSRKKTEQEDLSGVVSQVDAISNAVEKKNSLFLQEGQIVARVAATEVQALSKVEGALDGITNAAKKKNNVFNANPSDGNTTNKTNNQRKTSTDNGNSEDKIKKKTDEQIRDERDATTLKQYDTVLKEYLDLEQQRVNLAKQGNAQLSGEQEIRRLSYIEKLNDIQDKWNSTQEHSNKLWDEFNKKVSNRDNRQQKLDTDLVSNYNAWAKAQTHYGNRLSSISTLKNERALRPEAFTSALDDLETKGKELQSLFPLEPTDESGLRRAHELSDEIQQMSKEIRSNPEYKNARDTAIASLNKRAEQWASNNSAAIKADPEGFEQVRQAIKDINTLSDQNAASKMLDDFIAKSNQAGKAGLSFADTVKQRFKSLGAYLASFASFYDFIRYGREAIQTITELDTAMTELKKVSDESAQSYSNFMKNSFDMADKVGTTSEQIIQSTADWKRLGKSFEEAQKLAQQSTMLMNVSEFTSIQDATDAMVSATQAYTDVASEDIIDKLNHVGNNFAVGTSELATGLQNAAAVLKTQGNDIDQALALLTTGK